MRVTEGTNFDTVREGIRRTKERMEGLQRQTATLRKINAPSDDPIGSAKIMEIRTDKVNNDQFQMNGKMAETYLTSTDHALGEISELLVRAKEIAIGQASGASSNEDSRLGVAEEIAQLYKQAVSIANWRVGDRYIFGGYKNHKPPVDPDGKYLGDDGQQMVEIAKDVFLTTNVPGVEAFNTVMPKEFKGEAYTGQSRGPANDRSSDEEAAAARENVNVFDELQNLRIGLLTGDLEGIRSTLERFDQIHSHLVSMRAKVGSRVQGLHSMNQSLERQNVTTAQLGSYLEDADMAQVVSDLAKEETVFRSALSSSQRLIQPTLMDFLK